MLQPPSPVCLIRHPFHQGSDGPHLLVKERQISFGHGLGVQCSLLAPLRVSQLLLEIVNLELQLGVPFAEMGLLKLQLLAIVLGEGSVDPRDPLIDLFLDPHLPGGQGVLGGHHLALHRLQPFELQVLLQCLQRQLVLKLAKPCLMRR